MDDNNDNKCKGPGVLVAGMSDGSVLAVPMCERDARSLMPEAFAAADRMHADTAAERRINVSTAAYRSGWDRTFGKN